MILLLGLRRLVDPLNVQIRVSRHKSALFVNGRNASQQFAVVTPDTEFAWVKEIQRGTSLFVVY